MRPAGGFRLGSIASRHFCVGLIQHGLSIGQSRHVVVLENVDNVIIGPQNKRREIPLPGISPATTTENLSRNIENQHLPSRPVSQPVSNAQSWQFSSEKRLLKGVSPSSVVNHAVLSMKQTPMSVT